jgi:hypothetical protein
MGYSSVPEVTTGGRCRLPASRRSPERRSGPGTAPVARLHNLPPAVTPGKPAGDAMGHGDHGRGIDPLGPGGPRHRRRHGAGGRESRRHHLRGRPVAIRRGGQRLPGPLLPSPGAAPHGDRGGRAAALPGARLAVRRRSSTPPPSGRSIGRRSPRTRSRPSPVGSAASRSSGVTTRWTRRSRPAAVRCVSGGGRRTPTGRRSSCACARSSWTPGPPRRSCTCCSPRTSTPRGSTSACCCPPGRGSRSRTRGGHRAGRPAAADPRGGRPFPGLAGSPRPAPGRTRRGARARGPGWAPPCDTRCARSWP